LNKTIRQTVFPLLAAMIWGGAFAFQSISTGYVGPLTFTCARAVIAALSLTAVIAVLRAVRRQPSAVRPASERSALVRGGLCCGAVMSVAATLQQAGLADTSAGKTAFITALYIVIVPIAGIVFGRRLPLTVWIGVALAVAGLYFLCIRSSLSLSRSDGVVLLSAFCFAAHILTVDHFVASCDPIELSCLQFVTEAVLCGIGALLFENPSFAALRLCAGSLLYVGVFSSAVAFTLQIVAQKGTDPTIVSILLGLESLFGAVFGALLLHESLSSRELFGGALMLAATVFSQLPDRRPRLQKI